VIEPKQRSERSYPNALVRAFLDAFEAEASVRTGQTWEWIGSARDPVLVAGVEAVRLAIVDMALSGISITSEAVSALSGDSGGPDDGSASESEPAPKLGWRGPKHPRDFPSLPVMHIVGDESYWVDALGDRHPMTDDILRHCGFTQVETAKSQARRREWQLRREIAELRTGGLAPGGIVSSASDPDDDTVPTHLRGGH
jgi:hypothetical protein